MAANNDLIALTPLSNDVIPGKGHRKGPGNQYFIRLVKDTLDEFNQAQKKNKPRILAQIVFAVNRSGGRFLGLDKGEYYVMTNKQAVEKTRQCFINLNDRLRRNAAQSNATTDPYAEIMHLSPEDLGGILDSIDEVLPPETRSSISAMSSIRIDLNLTFIQERDMGKIENVVQVSMKEGRLYTGSTMGGKAHGRGIMNYEDGKVIIADWFQGAVHGHASVFYADGGNYYGTFLHNKRAGYGVRIFGDGSKYVGPYINNEQNGKGVITYRDGSSVDGDFEDGKLEGFATFTSSDGQTTAMVNYKNGERQEW